MATVNNRMFDVLTLLRDTLKNGDLEKSKSIVSFALELSGEFSPYINKHGTEISEHVKQLVNVSQVTDWGQLHNDGVTKIKLKPIMCSGDYEALLLQMLARITKTKNVLEIGMFVGSTTLALAELESVRNVTTLDIEPYLLQIAEPIWTKANVHDKIRVIIDDGLKSLETLASEKQKFDMIFIDANKDGYIDYYESILKHDLLSENGAIYVDDTLLDGHVWTGINPVYSHRDIYFPDPSQIHKFNQYVKADNRVDVVFLPARYGLSIITKRANC